MEIYIKTVQKVLNILSDGQFHSGEIIGHELGISRSAIWKAINHLKNLGLDIQSITRKGYRIDGGIELLKQQEIYNWVSTKNRALINNIEVLQQIDSTNSYLLEQAILKPTKNIACFAEQQTHGRGRRGRHWTSPFGNNIYHSLLWNFSKDPAEIMGLSLVTSVAIIRALKRYGITQELSVKWPNDILYLNKKLAGVLIEMHAESHGHCAAVIGVGINTHLTQKQASSIDQPWTSISEITQQKTQRNKLAGILLDELIVGIQQFDRSDLSIFIDEWQQYNAHSNKIVTLHTATNKMVKGKFVGITNQGAIIIADKQAKTQHYFSGELSFHPTGEA